MNNDEFSDNSDSDDLDFDPNQNQDIDNDSDDSTVGEKCAQDDRKSSCSKKKRKRKTKINPFKYVGGSYTLDGGREIVEDANLNADAGVEQEKQAEDEAKEKARTDILWADFLSSVESDKKRKSSSYAEETKLVTKVYNFAGQRLEVEEEVKVVSSTKSESSKSMEKTKTEALPGPIDGGKSDLVDPKTGVETAEDQGAIRDRSHIPKRKKSFLSSSPDEIGLGADSKGLKSVVNAIFAKNKKVNTLYKTKIDWKKYKQENNIDAELQLHRNSKNGYVDKQEFLQRTDIREFERERDLRAHARRKTQQ